MNPAIQDTGPDSGAIPLTLTIVDGPTGAKRVLDVRGLLAYKPPDDSLGASEWTAWVDTISLSADERIARVLVPGPDIEFQVLYPERTGGPLFGAQGSDLTRLQLAALEALGAMVDFDPADFDTRDFA